MRAAELRSSISGKLVDILGNISSIQLFASKTFESDNLKLSMNKQVKAAQERDIWILKLSSFQGLSFVLYQAITFLLLIESFKDGSVTAGDFALLIGINLGIIDILWGLSHDMVNFAGYYGDVVQGLNIVLAPLAIKDQPDAKELVVSKGCIKLDNIAFNHNNTSTLFRNKSVTIEAGQKVGLVGYSGSGKSTFVNLILRLYNLDSGSITIDDQDVNYITLDSLRKSITFIPQEPSLFHRTLMENLRYGKEGSSDTEVIECSKRAHTHEFIMDLPLGYDSLVGERGIKLSGGQRQRIAIARAILKNSPILILDEATSQLDSITESLIQESLLELMRNKTTIIIAHRLSTLLHMDRILVFDKGAIIEDGSHTHLIKKDGVYKKLWDAQVGGFLGN
jgi:ATP-binding cassette subfamily B protein